VPLNNQSINQFIQWVTIELTLIFRVDSVRAAVVDDDGPNIDIHEMFGCSARRER